MLNAELKQTLIIKWGAIRRYTPLQHFSGVVQRRAAPRLKRYSSGLTNPVDQGVFTCANLDFVMDNLTISMLEMTNDLTVDTLEKRQ